MSTPAPEGFFPRRLPLKLKQILPPKNADMEKKFDQCSEFISHLVMTHIKSATQNKSSRCCKWQIAPGVSCGVEDIKDWREHFAEIHGLNLDESIFVEFSHYEVLFDPFSLWPSEGASISLLPIGITETEKYIEYTPGSGFDRVLPEFHGHFSDGIALIPGFCPTCVFDKKLPMYMRMHQFSNVFRFMQHFNHIHQPHFSDSENLCPVPFCGYNRFTKQELILHLIKFHHIPLASMGKHYRVKRLLLPSPDMEAVKYKRRKKSEGFWCLGCSGKVNDINKHLQRPQNSEEFNNRHLSLLRPAWRGPSAPLIQIWLTWGARFGVLDPIVLPSGQYCLPAKFKNKLESDLRINLPQRGSNSRPSDGVEITVGRCNQLSHGAHIVRVTK
ncbi:hypothetical protein F5051DRAFT_481471 [Lentinula edodes]|nr:hypothetical protein F5051DRAFT_481471 [Lentinula edodes]